MVRINGEDKALAGINLLEYLKDAETYFKRRIG